MSVEDDVDTLTYDVDEEAHITVDNEACVTCEDKPCLDLCPVECFDHQPDRRGEIYFSYERCVECGACMVFCENDPEKGAVTWSKTRGGHGVEFDFG